MKNNVIKDAWDGILPDEAAKQRMLGRVTEYRAAHSQKHRRRLLWIPVAAGALAAVALAVWGGVQLHRFDPKLPVADPGTTFTTTETAWVSTGTQTGEPTATETEGNVTVSRTKEPTETAPTSSTRTSTSRVTAPTTVSTTEVPRPTETASSSVPAVTTIPDVPPTGIPTYLSPQMPTEPPRIQEVIPVTLENGDILSFYRGFAGEPASNPIFSISSEEYSSKAYRVVSKKELAVLFPFLETASSSGAFFNKKTDQLALLKTGEINGVHLRLARFGLPTMSVANPDGGADSTVQGVQVRAGYFFTPYSESKGGFLPVFYAKFTLGEVEVYTQLTGEKACMYEEIDAVRQDFEQLGRRLARFILQIMENGEPDMDAIPRSNSG